MEMFKGLVYNQRILGKRYIQPKYPYGPSRYLQYFLHICWWKGYGSDGAADVPRE